MLAIWDTFIAGLDNPASHAVYTLLALLLLAAASLLLQRRTGNEGVPALVNRGMLSLFALRILALPVSGLAWQGNSMAIEALPAVERSVHLLSIVLLVWLWLGARAETELSLLGVGLALGLGTAAGMLSLWLRLPQETAFNFSALDYLWGGFCGLLLSVGLVLVLRRRASGWRAGTAFFLLLLAGQGLHLVLALPGGTLPVAAQLSVLLALPLLYALPTAAPARTQPVDVVRSDLEEEDSLEAFEDYLISQELDKPVHAFIEEADEGTGLVDEDKAGVAPWAGCEALAHRLADALRAEACALARLDMGAGRLIIECGFDPYGEELLAGVALELAEVPKLASALQRGRPLRLAGADRHTEIGKVVEALGLENGEHLLAARLAEEDGRELVALLLRADQAWSLEDEQILTGETDEVEDIEEDWEVFSQATEKPSPFILEADEEPEPGPFDEWEAGSAFEVEDEEFGEAAEILSPPPAPEPHIVEQLEQAEAEKAQYQRDIERLLEHIDRLQREPPPRVRAVLERQAAVIEDLQAENEELRAASRCWDESDGPVSVPSSLEAQQAKEELRLALQQVADLQSQLDEALRQPEQGVKAASNGDAKIPADKAELIASIAQELRQPLSSVLGYTDLLLSESVGILGALQRNFLERVRSSTARMNTLIDNLIHIAELDSAGFTLEPKPVDLGAVIDDAIGLIRPHIQEKEIILRVDMPPQLPELRTDRDALQQILFHLLQNADAATPAEGEITLRAFTERQADLGEFVMIQVADSGGGIPEDELPRVFSRVYRAKNPIIQGVGDTGVGLTIAETLTEALGGRIWVESEEGVGATFSVLLPLQSPVIPNPEG